MGTRVWVRHWRHWKEAAKIVFSSTTHVCAQSLALMDWNTNPIWCCLLVLSSPGVGNQLPSCVSWVDVVEVWAAVANSRSEKVNKGIFIQSKLVFSSTPRALGAVSGEKRAKLPQSSALLEEIAGISILQILLRSLLKCPADTGLGRISMSTYFFGILIVDWK